VLRGTVKADGDVGDISITLAPIELGEEPAPESTALGFTGGQSAAPTGKIWSARFGRVDTINPIRLTEAIAPITKSPEADGVWLFTDVALRQSYEIVFAKPGFDTQSFVLSPPADGSPVELDVELKPARGSVGGTVRGPSGPLGGVEIVVSDGTLTFTTTSATDGAIGTWSLEGVSTPSVYTVSGTLRGYGTEVLQVRLGAGEERSGADLNMRRGVGAVSGRVVDESGQAIGGATVTATNGDITRSTSTLTEGDVGSYNLPQLDIPGTYTIRVELDGYITQTRRIPLGGSIPNVNFVLSGTSLQLTGRISSAGGGGVANAGVILTTGDLKFRVATAVAPDAGAFSIADLPPGNYTVTVEHFQHVTTTELITLHAGLPPPPLDITLEQSSGPRDIGKGSLVVTVLDSDPLADPQGVVGATVTLVRTRTGEIERVVTDPASANIRIDDIPIGTYTLLVSAPGFNDTPAGLVTIGLAEERRTIRLQELGQATGQMVDSLTGETLTGYWVSLFQERATGDVFIDRFGDDNGVWQTDPDLLSTGTYRIEIVDGDAPVGYVVRHDQPLDPIAAKPMTFVVPVVTTADQIIVGDIEADPYPEITGRVFKPELDGGGAAFVPIDDSTLTVDLTCNGSTATGITPLDVAGVVNGTAYDEFKFTKEVVAGLIPVPGDLGGSCDIAVAADNYEPITITLDNIEASNGRTRSDRRVNSALVAAPTTPLAGTVYWVDETRLDPADRIPLDGVAISASDPIIGFVPSEATTSSANPLPGISRDTLTTTSDALGGWGLDGQIFGTSAYEFIESGFGPGVINVTIDQLGARTVTAGAGVVLDSSGPGFAVELEPPNKGVVQGQANIITVATPKYDEIKITATDPFGNELKNELGDFPDPVTPDGAFTITDADAGTWNVTFEAPANHEFFNGATNSVTQLVGPGETRSGFDTTLVELGYLDVKVFDNGSPGTALPGATVELVGFPSVGPSTGPNGSGVYSLNEIPVGTTNPAVIGVSRTFKITVPGYDPDSAIITSNVGIVSQNGADDVTLLVRAGQKLTLDIGLDPLGSVTGTVTGRNGLYAASEELALIADDPAGKTTVTAVQVRSDGTPLQSGDPGFGDDPATVIPGVDPLTFQVTGLPGFYKLTVTNPEYEATPAVVPIDPLNPPVFPETNPLPPTALRAGVFEIKNGQTNQINPYELDIIEGSLNIRAVDSLAGDADVTGAVYDLFPNDGSCNGTPPSTLHGTIPSGGADVNLPPGQYCLKINRYDATSGLPDAFPAITTLTIARAVDGTPSSLSVRAPLPDQAPSVYGRISAVNEANPAAPVKLPPLSAFTVSKVTSTYTGDKLIDVGNGQQTNLNSSDREAVVSLADPVDQSPFSYKYLLQNLPAGVHEITAPDLPGYTLNTKTITVTIGGTGPVNVALNDTDFDFVYTAQNSDVTVVLDDGAGGGDYPDITKVELRSPSKVKYPGPSGTYTFDEATDTIKFVNVAPEEGNWEFTFKDALHTNVDKAVVTIPLTLDANGNRLINSSGSPAGTFETTPEFARLTGTIQQRMDGVAANNTPLASDGQLTLRDSTGAIVDDPLGADLTINSPFSTYEFDVAPGVYSLEITSPEYVTKTISTIDLSSSAGKIDLQDPLTIDKYAKVTVVIDNVPPPDLPTNMSIKLLPSGSGPDSGTTNEFTFTAGTFQFQITGDNYPTHTSGQFTYSIGDDKTEHVTLDRYVKINVKDPAGAAVSGVTVEVSATGYSNPKTATAGQQQFDFSSSDATKPLPASGALTVKVSAAGYRTQVIGAGEVLNFERNVVLHADVIVSGTITGADDGPISATAPAVGSAGASTKTGTITGGSYSIGGLGVGLDGEDRTWTIAAYDVVGSGTSPATTIDVTSISADTVVRNITITPQNLTLDFKVTTGAGPAANVKDAVVALGVATDTTGGNGEATLTLLETVTPLTWTVDHPEYLQATNTISLSGSRTIAVSVPLTPRPAITGTVVEGTTGIAGAGVSICPSTATAAVCGSPLFTTSSSGIAGSFSFADDVPTGSYEVWAVTGSGATEKSGHVPLTVNADNSFTFTSGSVISIS